MGNRAERGQSRVGTVGKLIAVGAISLGLGGVAEACGSNGDNTPIAPTANVLKTETPMPSATATQLNETPTIAPTPEPTEITPIVNPLNLVNNSIYFFENNLPPNVEPGIWNLTKTAILEGLDDQGGRFGLLDLKTALENGDYEAADLMLSPEFFRSIANPGLDPSVVWTKEEIDKNDPKRLLISPDSAYAPIASFTLDVAIDLIKIKYALHK